MPLSPEQLTGLYQAGRLPEADYISAMNAQGVSVAPAASSMAPAPLAAVPPIPVSYDTGYQPDTAAMDGGSVNNPARATMPENQGLDNLGQRIQTGFHNMGVDNSKPSANVLPADFQGPAPYGVVQQPVQETPLSRAQKEQSEANLAQVPKSAPASIPEQVITGSKTASLGGPAAPKLIDPRTDTAAHEQSALDKEIEVENKRQDLLAQRQVELATQEKANQDALDQQDVLAKAKKQEDDGKVQLAVDARLRAIDNYNNSSIDPDKIWKEKGDFARVAAALAIGFGAYAQGYSQGRVPNAALQIITGMIDRDIHAQEVELDKKGKSVDMATNSLAVQRQLSGDNRSAESAERLKQIENYKMGLSSMIARYDNADMKLAGQKVIEKLDAQKMQIADQLKFTQYQEELQRQARNAQAQAAREKEQRETQFKYDMANKDIAIAQMQYGQKAGEKTITIPGSDGVSRQYQVSTEKDAEEMKSAAINLGNIQSGLNRLQEIRAKNSGGTINPGDVAEGKTIAANLRGLFKDQMKLGALSGSDYKMIDAIVPEDPNQYSPLGSTDTQLKAAQGVAARGFTSAASVRVPGWKTTSSVPTTQAPGK